jgi:hypothetical protein
LSLTGTVGQILTGQAKQKWMVAEFNNNTQKLEPMSSHEMKNQFLKQ